MTDFEKTITREIAEIKSQLDTISSRDKAKSSFLSNLSAIAPIIQGLLIAGVGMIATVLYNDRQLDLSQLAALDKYRSYLASDDSQERIFGYEAFLTLGQEDFVIRLIAAKNDTAGEEVLKSIEETSSSSATREAAGVQLEKLRVEIENQKSLGRRELLKGNLDNLIELVPDDERARLERNTPEDWQYLVDRNSSVSAAPYLSLAKENAAKGDTSKALSLIKLAAERFQIGVIDLDIDFDSTEIDLVTIRDSIGIFALDESWFRPSVWNTSIAVGNRVILWNEIKDPGIILRFQRYGFQTIDIEIGVNEFTTASMQKRTIIVRRTDESMSSSDFTGVVRLSDGSNHSGIHVSIVDNFFENKGFAKNSVTDDDGQFLLESIPDGTFEIVFRKPGYVSSGFSVKNSGNRLLCLINAKRHYDKAGIQNCELKNLDIRLHPIKQVSLSWTLQELYEKQDFRDTVSNGQVELTTALADDWRRGGWSCCEATYSFGPATIDAPNPDIVFYTETDGTIFAAQQASPNSLFIARSAVEYEDLSDATNGITFLRKIEVEKGNTYILKTSNIRDPGKRHYVKIRIDDIK